MSEYKAVLFDLDGTLIDTSPGILNGIDYMLPKMDLEPLDMATKVKFIGPSLSEAYPKYLGLTGKRMEKAIEIYRDYCKTKGYKEFKHYPGMKELLEELKKEGILTFIVTMKKQSITDMCVEASGFKDDLTYVLGNNDLESISKAGLINEVLEKYNLTKDEVLLVGDTDVDARGAYQAGVDFYPALYGFGYSQTGFTNKYPYKHFLNKPLELLDFIKERR